LRVHIIGFSFVSKTNKDVQTKPLVNVKKLTGLI
jgi:hypothetical protein